MKKKLFLKRSVEINAPASKVWKVLIDPAQKYGTEWTHFVTLESDWKLGSPMHWKFGNGISAEGKILAIKPYTLLSFSFKGGAPHPVDETFRLKEHEGHTTLMVSIGDFEKDPTLKLHYYPLAVENWDKYFLPKIKELAEK
jgi:uncharacterized protein YndB with AHSA1/START domain